MSKNKQNKHLDEFEIDLFDIELDFDKRVSIMVIGKVSTGKSSLINAILARKRDNPIAEVGAAAGVTTEIRSFKLDKHVMIIDSPGLDDVRQENSSETISFMKHVDIGIMVVTGSADVSQRKIFNDLRTSVKHAFVVLNKIDEWDDLDESALTEVVQQWQEVLGVKKVYPTCTKGYDPRMKKDAPMDLRGIQELNKGIWGYLNKEGKSLLLARHYRK